MKIRSCTDGVASAYIRININVTQHWQLFWWVWSEMVPFLFTSLSFWFFASERIKTSESLPVREVQECSLCSMVRSNTVYHDCIFIFEPNKPMGFTTTIICWVVGLNHCFVWVYNKKWFVACSLRIATWKRCCTKVSFLCHHIKRSPQDTFYYSMCFDNAYLANTAKKKFRKWNFCKTRPVLLVITKINKLKLSLGNRLNCYFLHPRSSYCIRMHTADCYNEIFHHWLLKQGIYSAKLIYFYNL